jgi:cytidine deaminase
MEETSMILTDEFRQKLIESSLGARHWAYAPYSRYMVGAALLTSSGKIYDGVNVENAVYSTTICAERVAIFKAVSEGERKFTAIAVATSNGGTPCGACRATSNGGTPCGACRQVLSEFGLDIQVLIVNGEGIVEQETTVAELLPGAFGPQDLPDQNT